ncbi:hypothetical protein HNR46_001086 [Haloferula luteola]|uniref:SLA1 homology domain-containing protein n=1 Tax=Haloferula luteola TaxID=595692 RepID=A0A840UYJ6_9BACT|nr:SHD1 domain-containing protein [Haloferula luteola]MBB5350852.1 hypothetical protein [Haloferula luteola]
MKKRILPGVVGLALWTGQVDARVWTDVQGREIEADYVSSDDEEVVLRLPGGKNVTVPFSRLSPRDVEYARQGGGDDDEQFLDDDDEDTGSKGGSTSEVILNWDEPWPDTVVFKEDPEVNVAEEDDEKKRWVYESSNYRFICDVRLSKSVVSNFAEMFESTLQFTRALPIAISGGRQTNGKFQILLFEEFSDYVKAGGPPSSAGVFMGGENVVMVPLVSLGVRKVGSGYMRDRDKSNKTLVHELTHQLTPDVYYREGSRGWFTEGLAEYCANTPYRNGRFTVRSSLKTVEENMTGYDRKTNRGRAMGTEFSVPGLRQFMEMDYADFTGSSANENYGWGALLTTYFVHLDGEGNAARLKAYLKKLREIGPQGDIELAYAELLDGRTWAELEKDISKAWSRKGVDVEFEES